MTDGYTHNENLHLAVTPVSLRPKKNVISDRKVQNTLRNSKLHVIADPV